MVFPKGCLQSEKSKLKRSESMKAYYANRTHHAKGIKHTKGCILWNKGKSLSPEHIQKVKDNHSHSTPWLGKKRGSDFRIAMSLRQTGDLEFEGFKTKENTLIRKSVEYKLWRDLVFQRDSFTCQNKQCVFCDNDKGVALNAHHIKQLSTHKNLAFEVSNGITFCQEYHMALHGLNKRK